MVHRARTPAVAVLVPAARALEQPDEVEDCARSALPWSSPGKVGSEALI